MQVSDRLLVDPAVQMRVAAVERRLPRSLPDEYRTFLERDRPAFPALGPWDDGWERVVTGFLREWHPLAGYLFPVEHCGDGIFACFWLRHSGASPVVAWDIAADLGEQPAVELAPDWTTYLEGRTTYIGEPDQGPVIDPLADATRTIGLRHRIAEQDLNARLEAFRKAEEHFNDTYARAHQGTRFEHHLGHGQIRSTEWRPERFAVQDHLLGVMASRYNKPTNTIDAVGFATRDHTNYARGSATAAQVISLLCDCAAKAAAGLRFLVTVPHTSRDEQISAVPQEIALLGSVLGVDLDPRSAVIPADAAGRLLLELTAFDADVRRSLANSRLNLLRLCLAVHKQIWSPLEAALLARWCAEADNIFAGDIDAGEIVRFASALNHCASAVLAAFGAGVVNAAIETAQTESCPFDVLGRQYSIACRPTTQTSWIDAVDGSALHVEAGRHVIIVGLPIDNISADGLLVLDREIEEMLESQSKPLVLAVVPSRSHVTAHGRLTRVVATDVDIADLEMRVHERLRKGRRVRS